MKCILLAAGYATRLYPLTENFPKLLLKVGEKTILDWLMDDVKEPVDKLITLYDIMRRTDGIYGGRFSGAGFKGCCMALIDLDKSERILHTVEREYLKVYPALEGKYMAALCHSADGVKL